MAAATTCRSLINPLQFQNKNPNQNSSIIINLPIRCRTNPHRACNSTGKSNQKTQAIELQKLIEDYPYEFNSKDSPPSLPRPLTSAQLTKLATEGSRLRVAYQGVRGAYSESAAEKAYPNCEAVPCEQFDTAFENQHGVQKYGGGDISQPLHSSSSDGISELEQLLKQKTFSRSEIDHLTELLRSRAAVELSLGVDGKISESTPSELGRHQAFANSPLEQNTNEGDRSRGVMSTPISNSRVIEDDMASPAELAKAYMGSRPSKVFPSMLGTRSQVGREDSRLLGNIPFASKPSSMALTMKTSVSIGAPENGFITPKPRGRSAIYSMARTPYSRVNPLNTHKGFGLTDNGYGGSSMSSSTHFLAEQNDKFEPKPMALKRRSSVLDDDLGSIGPIRRIRQKPNLLASRNHVTARGVESGSDSVLVSSKQRLPLSVEPKIGVSKTVGENEDGSIPSASYAHVPSKSSEVAARILQHLEKLTPKEKSTESKSVSVREKSQFRLNPSMLRGQALRSMEDVDSSKLLLDVHDDHKVENRFTATLTDARDSTSQKVGKLEENSPKESVVRSDMLNPVMKNDFVESLKAPGPSTGTADSVVNNSVAQPSQKKRAFRMSAQEDSLEQDDDIHCYGLAPGSLDTGRGPTDAPVVDNGLSLVEEPKLVKTTIQPEVMMPSGLVSSKTSESGSSQHWQKELALLLEYFLLVMLLMLSIRTT